jgi:hypothetical protein
MTLTTSTTYAGKTIAATLDLKTYRVSLIVNGKKTDEGRWNGGGIWEHKGAALNPLADYEARVALFDLNAGLRTKIAKQTR